MDRQKTNERWEETAVSKFIVRRVALAIVIIFLGAFIVYGVMRCMPTSYVEKVARQRAAASATTGGKSYKEWLDELNESYHMNDGVVVGYLNWVGNVLRGEITPADCPLFGKVCTPLHPVGACMVSGEGACSAYYQYGGDLL